MKNKKKIIFIIILILLLSICILFYKVYDNKKNKSQNNIKKEIKKEKTDTIKPEITLLGKPKYTLVKGSIYEEYGAVATDNIDKDITDKIEIKNNLDINKEGNYEIIYSVKDSSDNISIVKRIVSVIKVEDKATEIPVLMYHYFYDETIEEGKDSNYLSKSKFEEQLKYLKDNNYYFPTMKEIDLFLDNKIDLPKKSVVITIDDGAVSSYTIAYPLAKQYQIPMVMFVVTSWTNPKEELQTEMINSGYIYMQSHTHNMHKSGCPNQKHGAYIQCVPKEEGINDLKESVKILNSNDSIAYPCGDYNEHAIEIVKEAGIKLAFTTEYGKVNRNSNRYYLPRVRINSSINLNQFISSL